MTKKKQQTTETRPAGMSETVWVLTTLPTPCETCENVACRNAKSRKCPHWKTWLKAKWRSICYVLGKGTITRSEEKELEDLLRLFEEEERNPEAWMGMGGQ